MTILHPAPVTLVATITAVHPLPWRVDGEGIKALLRADDAVIVAVRHRSSGPVHEANFRYLAHASNAYPRLVAALREARDFMEPLGAGTVLHKTEALLRELGEIK